MKSCIYEGLVTHSRTHPRNSFRYSLFMVYLDLAEMDEVFRGRWLWSTDRFNIASFNRKYHLGDPRVPLDQAVREMVRERLGREPAGSIRMLTQLRYFGHNFNPVSFYYCYNREDTHVETIVTEIHNTPWGELFCYVLGEDRNEPSLEEKRFRFAKNFHISPFMDMDLDYEWKFTEPGSSLHVQMTNSSQGREIFRAELAMDRHEITGPELARMLLRYPFMNMKIISAIYWQAFTLWRKGAHFYTHPRKRRDKRGASGP